MISAGNLSIEIQRLEHYCQAQVLSTRPPDLYQFFTGKPVEQMLKAVPLLFSICRGAQSVAAVRAAEHALQIKVSLPVEQQRDRLIGLEMLHEHLWQLLVALPPLLELPARRKEMAAFSRILQNPMQQLRLAVCHLAPDSALYSDVGPEMKAFGDIQDLIFGDRPGDTHFREPWLPNSGFSADLLRALNEIDFSRSGRLSGKIPARIDEQDLRSLLTSPTSKANVDDGTHYQSAAYCSAATNQPSAAYQPSESGPSARMARHPWLESYTGGVLSARLVALLAETHQQLQDMILSSAGAESTGYRLAGAEPNMGCAEVETARGRLICALAVSNQTTSVPVLTRMKVMAPTDGHFHPRGIAVHVLSKLPVNKLRNIRQDDLLLCRRANLLIQLINPCVAYRLNVRSGANGGQGTQAVHASTADWDLAISTEPAGSVGHA